MKISTTYRGSKRFSSGNDHVDVVMDAKPEAGGLGEAPNPKQMVLHGLAGCTGLDVVAILEKKKVDYDSFSLDVEAEQTSIHPKHFKSIKILYRFVADEDARQHIERAVELSTKQFCGGSHRLAKSAAMTAEIMITPRS